MKKVLVVGPTLSRSGYGEMARNAVKALLTRPGQYQVYIQNTQWGGTGNIINKHNPEFEVMQQIIRNTLKTAHENGGNIDIDMTIQVGLPNEWKKLSPYDIGYTAGIETNYVSGAWLKPSQEMKKIIVISNHAKNAFLNTDFGDALGNKYRITTPIEVVHFPVKNVEKENIDLKLDFDFNFLTVSQWGPRKNLEQTIVNFIEEFKNEEVGLVIKTNMVTDSLIDRELCESKLKEILSQFPDRKCKVYLLHGVLSDSQINALYNHPKIKAFVTATHGEGYGLPLFEAAYNELPVIATDWSGHLDFLTMKDEEGEEKKMFAKVDYEMVQLAPEHVWPGILEAGTSWAYPKQNSLKGKMRDVYKDYGRFKSWAKKLNNWIRKEFTEEKVYNKFINSFHKDSILEQL